MTDYTMSKYIDAEKLKCLLDAKYKDFMGKAKNKGYTTLQYQYMADGIDIAEQLIDSLQQEQPALPGIEDPGIPGKDFIPVGWVDACEKYGKWKIVKVEQPEVDLEEEIHDYLKTYHLHIKDGGRVVFDNGDSPNFMCDIRDIAHHFYELGLKARKEG
jgi:hypothetical protein